MATITTSVGSPGTVSAASGGQTFHYNNISTTPIQILGANSNRQKITVHNPGTIDVFVAPSFVQTSGSDVALVPSPSALGGCLLVYANGGTAIIDGECTKPYQAFSRSGSLNPLTVIASNV